MRKLVLAAAASALAIAAPAQAVIFTLGNNPQPNEQNILFADQLAATTLIGTGSVTPTNTLTLTGTTLTGVSTVGTTFNVTGNIIDPASGVITGITMTPNSPLLALIFDPNNGSGANLHVAVTLTDSSILTFDYSLGSGANFLTITTSPGEAIQSAALTSGVGFEDLRSLRAVFAPATEGGVPEPATWAMMLLGFGAIGVAMRRKPSLVTA